MLLGNPSNPDLDQECFDTAETLFIPPAALLHMLRHARAGVPLEVMGLMVGEHVDKYTARVRHVFAMPQMGTGVNVSAIDPAFQVDMLGLLQARGLDAPVVGWYHSHPGFGCWLSYTDISTHHSFEKLDPRAIAVVIDPIQSVKGRVVVDAFRSIQNNSLFGNEPRTVTSLASFEARPTITALLRGLNKFYYSLNIAFEIGVRDQQLLGRLVKKNWAERLCFGRPNAKDEKEEPFDFNSLENDRRAKTLGAFAVTKEKSDVFVSSNSFRSKALAVRKRNPFVFFDTEIRRLEDVERELVKEESFVKEFVENKFRVKASEETLLSNKKKEVVGATEKEDKNEHPTARKKKEDHIKRVFRDVKDALRLKKVGKIDNMKQVCVSLEKESEKKLKDILEISRMGMFLGCKNSHKIYESIYTFCLNK